MNSYCIKVRLYGHMTVESPDCPCEWQGSGCYDIDVHESQKATCYVDAPDKKSAEEKLTKQYEYDDADICVEGVEILSVECLGAAADIDTPVDVVYEPIDE